MSRPAQIKIVERNDRWRFSRTLMEMHYHRKRVFVDDMGWQLAAPGCWLEVDQFDHDHAVYILAISPEDGAHLGSVRLLPTTRPHMLGTVFQDLCPEGSPEGDDVWEVSRLVAAPEQSQGTNLVRIHRMLAASLVHFARMNGISRYTLVAESRRVPALLSVGWTVRPLSLPTMFNDDLIEALEIVLDDESVEAMRRSIGGRRPAEAARAPAMAGAA